MPNSTEAAQKAATLDFTKVDALRKHLLLTIAQMAKLLGVSRITYNAWVKGKPIRQSNDKHVRGILRVMLRVVTEEQWPTPRVIGMTSAQRAETLLEAMKKYE